MPKKGDLKNNSHQRGHKHRYRIKHGAFRYPDDVVYIEVNPYEQGANSPARAHIFCAHCGREITYYHVERARPVIIDRHVRVTQSTSEQLYYCLPYERCMTDRKIGIISQRIKTKAKQYTGGAREYGFDELW